VTLGGILKLLSKPFDLFYYVDESTRIELKPLLQDQGANQMYLLVIAALKIFDS